MLNKNQIYETLITDYTAEGQGIAHIEGCAVFIPNAVRGEKVTVRIEKAQKTWAAGKIVEILEKSPHRLNRECPVAKLCGGCDFWHIDYEEESRLKADRVKTCLNRMGGESLEEVPILSAPTCCGYRNKAQYPVAAKKGRAYAGFFRAGTHDVVENPRRLILPQETDAVKDAVIDYVNQYRVPVYDETAHTGLLRHIYVRRGVVSGQILVCLVVNGRKLPRVEELLKRLQKIPGFTTLVLSVNTKKGNAVLGDEFITLFGPGYIEDTLCGLNFRLSPRSFYQVNHHQAQRLYEAAITQAEITKNDTVLDLYCGVGTITLAMASAAGKVIGVEVIPQAVEDARDNAKRNGIENAEFFCGDAGQAALELEKDGVRPDVIVVDPPRKGLNADTIEAPHRMSPRRIVYVSCDPATLARDVALLKERGYQLKNALAADLFPRCAHVESVVTLTKKEGTMQLFNKYTGAFRKDSKYQLFFLSVLVVGLSYGLYKGVIDNFLAEIVCMTEFDKGLSEFFRELPGLALVFVLAACYLLSAEAIYKIGAVIMLVGMVMHTVVPVNKAMVILAIITYSLGDHIQLGMRTTLALEYAREGQNGRALGTISSIMQGGHLLGFLIISAAFLFISGLLAYRVVFAVSTILLALGTVFSLRLTGRSKTDGANRRFYFRKKYTKYYFLEVFYGARKQVFLTFGPYVLILFYGASTWIISLLFAVSAVFSFLLSPVIGRIIDKLGYKVVMVADTLILVIVCFFYGFAHYIFPMKIAFAVCCANYVLDSIISLASMASNVYVHDLADTPEEARATISTGISVNHLISIFIALFGGWIWMQLGMETLFVISAVLGLCNSAYAATIESPKKQEKEAV